MSRDERGGKHMDDELAGIKQARVFLAKHFPATKLVPAALGITDRTVYLKLECELPSGSFKVRGALYALSAHRERQAFDEVVAASTGNHGAAVAYAARLLGVPAKIFLPQDANAAKLARIVASGAAVVQFGENLTTAIDAAAEYAKRERAFFLHDANDPDIPSGTGTIGLEILEQLPTVKTIYAPVGDTALIRGVATAVKAYQPGVGIVGVVAEGAPSYYLSWKAGRVVETPSARTIADGLAVNRPLAKNVASIRDLVDDFRLVSDEELLATMNLLWTRQQIRAEPSGVAGLAAIMSRPEELGPSVALITGSNIAPHMAERLV